MMRTPIPPIAATIASLLISTMVFSSPPTMAAEETTELTNPAAMEGPARAYYRWIDESGRIQYTDFEPIGVPAELIPLTPPEDEADAPPLVRADGSTTSDPFHDQDQQILPIEHVGPCADARRQLTVLHAALPVYLDERGLYRNAWRGDSYRGDRNYLDAESRNRAISDARTAVLTHCSDPDAFAREEEAFRESAGGN